jgi:hypothetical protein
MFAPERKTLRHAGGKNRRYPMAFVAAGVIVAHTGFRIAKAGKHQYPNPHDGPVRPHHAA